MDIENYPEYQIYEDGRVFSKRKNIFMKPHDNGVGYLYVGLLGERKKKNYTIHRLVALHYIPNPEGKPEVDHIDRNKANNHISNLRWVTSSENNENQSQRSDNKSGHKYISYRKQGNLWAFQKTICGVSIQRAFKSKIDALCFKYIQLLKKTVIDLKKP